MNKSYFYLMCALMAVDMGLILASISNRDKKAVKSLIAMVTLILIAQAFYGISLVIYEPQLKFAVHELKFLGVAFFSTGFYCMYTDLFGHKKLFTKRNILLLCIVPAVANILSLTNNYHHLFRVRLYVVENDYGSFIGVQSGTLFWVYIIYSYFMYVSVMGLAVRTYLKTPRIYRIQLGIMVFAAFATLITNFISISNLFFEDFGDATLITATLAAIVQFYGLVLYKPSKMIHMARGMAVNDIRDPIVIFDYKKMFLDANTAAKSLLPIEENHTESRFLTELGVPPGYFDGQLSEYVLEQDDSFYTVIRKAVTDDDGVFTASVILLNDITEMKLRERELENIANFDYLTGIANRHSYLLELAKVRDTDLPLAIVRFDISGMKSTNHYLGYEAGDNIIKNTAQVLASSTEGTGFCARLWGDKFAILLNRTSEDKALQTIESIKAMLPGITLMHGLAVKRSTMDNINIIDKLATDALYTNKLLYHSKMFYSDKPLSDDAEEGRVNDAN